MKFYERKDFTAEAGEVSEACLIFVVGWQYLLNTDERYVVFHDSLLPKYRGFAPLVTALLKGDSTIGVSAIKPSKEADRGPVYCQVAVEIKYPIKVREALEHLSTVYEKAGRQVLEAYSQQSLQAWEQDEKLATYSLWRDEIDYHIDWSSSASYIRRFVDSLGWPYGGAKTYMARNWLRVNDVTEIVDLEFEVRQPGKVWALEKGRPIVVCGSGLLRIDSACHLDGTPVVFNKLRCRLGCYP